MNFANGIDDDELWAETEEAAQVLGFTDEQRIAMYKTCAGILHWGNGQFKQRPREEQAEVADSAGERPDPDFWEERRLGKGRREERCPKWDAPSVPSSICKLSEELYRRKFFVITIPNTFLTSADVLRFYRLF